MQKNLSAERVTSMYNSLAREAHDFWGMDIDPVPFTVRPAYATFFGGETFSPNGALVFSDRRPSGSMAATEFVMQTRPVWINFNEFWLEYLYEDEVICSLLHELAHVYTGWETDNGGHGPVWSQSAEEIGSVGEPFFSSRSAMSGVIPWVSEETVLWIRETYGQPTLGWL